MRRNVLLSGLLLAGAATLPPLPSRAQETAGATPSSSSAGELVAFSNPSQGYTLMRPASWEQVWVACMLKKHHRAGTAPAGLP